MSSAPVGDTVSMLTGLLDSPVELFCSLPP